MASTNIPTPPSVVVVGANLAGGTVARSLRTRGYEGHITLIGAEETPPYERPALSKQVLSGAQEPGELVLPVDWADLSVDLVLGTRVDEIRPAESTVVLSTGTQLAAGAVVLCTGGRGRRLGVEGEHLEGIHAVRTIEDSLALRSELVAGARVVVVGAGFIGAEVAATAMGLGCEVTVFEHAPIPLARSLGPVWGPFVLQEHTRRGAHLRLGTGVHRFLGDDRVREVEIGGGDRIPADVVVVGVGIEPATELAEGAGLAVAGGIHVDRRAATANPGVFAVGDATLQPGWRNRGVTRLESFQNAQEQADVAAAAILGQELPARDVPWFWSDQFEHNIQIAGTLDASDDIVVRGDRDGREFSAFHVRDGLVRGVFAINRGRDVRAAMRLISGDVVVDSEALADPDTDLRRLARPARAGSS
ncbi:FAD-dependent oxidoreductase [Pseudonocardia sp. NPDC049635]|uniref:NAD(P)/FAD-dependent oxidoreductase n=1 Tax=Pseudonocardia sp. NPDC049635 TaxID=3155506 RepID=UPI0033E63DE4